MTGLRRALRGPCVLCGTWPAQVLCADCHAQATRRRPRCPVCAAAAADDSRPCAACLRAAPAVTRSVTVADYERPWDRLIAEFKFQGRVELAPWLAQTLAQAVAEAAPAPVDLVVPVPLAPERLRERGYNQAWEIARRVAHRLGLPCQARALVRLIETPHQVGGTREERQRNMARALAVEPAWVPRLSGRRVALVDDVVTTGATIAAAAQVLRRAGVVEVQAWMLARTPAPQARDAA